MTVLISTKLTHATPTITFPFNSQVPPVIRISEPFSYIFSPSTFYSILPLSYTLSRGPFWLSLDNGTRTLSDTPSINDVGSDVVTGVPISLTASDSTGSITLHATLVISKSPAPAIRIAPPSPLPTFGIFSTPSTILYYPSTPFKFVFAAGTFDKSGGPSLSDYAVTVNNTPLPSWVLFHGNALSFTGQTPDYASLMQPPQIFDMQLIASDVEGLEDRQYFSILRLVFICWPSLRRIWY